MSRHHSVVWREGMFLAPQHFQEQFRANDAWSNERLRQLIPFAWGFRALDLDLDALQSGRFVVTQAAGMFPDGTPFRCPEFDELPEGRVVGPHFSSSARDLTVYLALAEYRDGIPNVAESYEPGGRPTRYLARSVERNDQNTGENLRPVEVGAKHLRILFDDESLDGMTVLPIARVEKTTTGAFLPSDQFAPPCMSVGASDALQRILQRMIELLASRSTALSSARRQKGAGAMEFGVSDLTTFWLLHSVNSALPGLRHALAAHLHPEECYRMLAALAGEVLTFMPSGHPAELPLYRHDEPFASLEQIEQVVRQGVELITSTGYVSIPLEKSRESLWIGKMRDDRVLEGAKLYLAVGGDIPDMMVGTELPQKVKIGSPNTIDRLIGAALRGIGISHLSWVPSQIPARAGYHYFQLETANELWNDIRLNKTIAIYLPAEYSRAKVELLSVKDA